MKKTPGIGKFILIILLLASVTLPAAAYDGIDLDYRSTDIKDVIRSLALIAGENVIVDDSAVGEVTVQLSDVTYEEAMEHLLNIKGLEAHEENGITIVAAPDRVDDLYREIERELISLDYIAAEKAQEILVEMIPEIDIQISPSRNRLILRGFSRHITEAKELLADIDEPADRDHRVVEVKEQNPQDIAEELRELFPELTVRPRSAAGDVIVQGKTDLVTEAADMIAELDVPDREVEEIYRVQELEPEELVGEISDLYPAERLQITREENLIILRGEPGPVEETLELLAELDEVEAVEERFSYRADYIDVEELEEIITELNPDLSVAKSEGERRIVIQGDESDIEQTRDLIADLDQPRRQVVIDVLIEEVSHTELEERGIDPNIFSDITTIGVDYEEGQIDVSAPDLFQVMEEGEASQTLANPRLMSLDGEEAQLTIGDRVPYEVIEIVDGEPQTVDYEYADVGINLDFEPRITSDNSVILNIKPEVSSITEMGGELTPPQVRTRELESVLSLQDGETFAVGGLIQDELEETVRKFPVLADLPILGELFRYTQQEEEKTEIIIFMTPEIIDISEGMPEDVMEDYDKIEDQFAPAAEERVDEFERETEETDYERVESEDLQTAISEVMEEMMAESAVKEDGEKRVMTAREINQILFRSRQQRRSDWPETYEFTFISDSEIPASELKELYNISADSLEKEKLEEGRYQYKLELPGVMVYEAEEGDTLEDLAEISGVPARNILEASRRAERKFEAGDILILPFDTING